MNKKIKTKENNKSLNDLKKEVIDGINVLGGSSSGRLIPSTLNVGIVYTMK